MVRWGGFETGTKDPDWRQHIVNYTSSYFRVNDFMSIAWCKTTDTWIVRRSHACPKCASGDTIPRTEEFELHLRPPPPPA